MNMSWLQVLQLNLQVVASIATTILLVTFLYTDLAHIYLRDSRQEFAKVGVYFPIFHAVVLLDPSN